MDTGGRSAVKYVRVHKMALSAIILPASAIVRPDILAINVTNFAPEERLVSPAQTIVTAA